MKITRGESSTEGEEEEDEGDSSRLHLAEGAVWLAEIRPSRQLDYFRWLSTYQTGGQRVSCIGRRGRQGRMEKTKS